jgi:hypothetical protein
VLGIAAFVGATAATVAVVVISHGDDPKVKPLEENTAKPEHRPGNGGEPWFTTPDRRSLPQAPASEARRRRARDRSAHGKSRTKPRGPRHEIAARSRTGGAEAPLVRNVSASPPAVARPAPASPPPSAPSVPATPAPTEEQSEREPRSTPEATPQPAPERRPVEIEIDDGELETDVDRVHPQDGQVRLHVRSDALVVVDFDDQELSRPVPAGGEATFVFDTLSTKGFKVGLVRRNGLLVLRVYD